MIDDATLLRRYAAERTEAAFAELVRRHLPLVYSSALRRLRGDVHGAGDIVQTVFAALAANAARLARHPVLTGWLFVTTRHAAIDLLRSEQRRTAREQHAYDMQTLNDTDRRADWEKLGPVIDAAMDELSDRDREAVLLRYFQSRPFGEIGTVLGTSEDAARKRVDRALVALKSHLARRGISSTAAVLAAVITNESVVAAPAALVATVISSSATVGNGALAGVAFMTTTKVLTAAAVALLFSGTVGLVWQERTISRLRAQIAATQAPAALAEADAALVKRREADEAPTVRRRSESVSAPIPDKPRTPATTAALSEMAAHADVPRDPQQLANLHRRYDPFLQRRGFTPAEVDRWIQWMMEKENIRLDIQAAMQQLGVSGGSSEVEKLRSELSNPLWQQMHEMLGDEGYAAFNDYETLSATVAPLDPQLAAANASLSDDQAHRLAQAIQGSIHQQRAISSSPTSQGRIEWHGVAQQASTFLTPTQLGIFQDFVRQQESR